MPPRPFADDDEDQGKTAQQTVTDLPVQDDVSFVVTVIDGPDRGASFQLGPESPKALVGTSPQANLRLSDRLISRRHASFELAGSRLRLRDEGSTNGTFVNGVAVVEVLLRGTEEVRLGTDVLALTPAGVVTEPRTGAIAFQRVLGASREMRRLYNLLARVAASQIPTVIEGETGTGKEAVAEAIHEAGPRARGPFVVFDCTAVPASMVEAELFGHERGAFTGADSRRIGLLEQAEGGTLLIDEIGDMDLALQPKLLRAIERREFRRIGGNKALQADVRILSATRRNLDAEVEAGRFRDDLFHRLAVARIELPPLRKRRGDVPLLVRSFCRELGGSDTSISAALLARWDAHDWPGNVRELRNAVARTLALGEAPFDLSAVAEDDPLAALMPATGPGARGEPSSVADIAAQVIGEGMPLARARQHVIDAFEAAYLEAMLARHGGVVTRAAAAAGVARRHFQRRRARTRDS
jgi:two-component system response regulator HydG